MTKKALLKRKYYFIALLYHFSESRFSNRQLGFLNLQQQWKGLISTQQTDGFSPSRCSWWGSGRRRCPRCRSQTGWRAGGCCCDSAGRPWKTQSWTSVQRCAQLQRNKTNQKDKHSEGCYKLIYSPTKKWFVYDIYKIYD